MALDPKTGAISQLRSKKTGREWASAEHPLALFSYQTQSKADFDKFLASLCSRCDELVATVRSRQAQYRALWRREPGVDYPSRKASGLAGKPMAIDCWKSCRSPTPKPSVQAERPGRNGCTLKLVLPDAEPTVEVNFLWFGKIANRMPEALWLSFLPQAPEAHGWTMEKVERPVSPFDVVPRGNRHMHALSGMMRYEDAEGKFSIEAIDAPVVALGEKSPIFFSDDQPDLVKGIHFNLFNNAWGSNYILWFSEDVRFRFKLRA